MPLSNPGSGITPLVWKSFNQVASGTTVWTPAAGKRIRVLGFILECLTAGNVVLTDTATTPNTPLVVPTNTTAPTVWSAGNGWLSGAPNNTLVATGPNTISGTIYGTEE